MPEFVWTLIGAGIVGIVVGIILLCLEYHTNWFAKRRTSSSKKQPLIKSSPKQLPSKKPGVIRGRRNQYTSISVFIKKEWWIGVGTLVIVMILILTIANFTLPGGFGNQIISPPPSDSKENSQQTAQPSEEPSTEYREHPSPSEIRDEIRSLVPYKQETVGEDYVGLKVQWYLKFDGISSMKSDSDIITIRLEEKELYSPNVYCDIDIREHPEIKTADKGDGVFVKGEISRAETYRIELINCTVKFD